jgi:hypothetical protein
MVLKLQRPLEVYRQRATIRTLTPPPGASMRPTYPFPITQSWSASAYKTRINEDIKEVLG